MNSIYQTTELLCLKASMLNPTMNDFKNLAPKNDVAANFDRCSSTRVNTC